LRGRDPVVSISLHPVAVVPSLLPSFSFLCALLGAVLMSTGLFQSFWEEWEKAPDTDLAGAFWLIAMSKTGALDLASGLGGKIGKEEVKSAVDEYVSESE
jgi:hypothetical protein